MGYKTFGGTYFAQKEVTRQINGRLTRQQTIKGVIAAYNAPAPAAQVIDLIHEGGAGITGHGVAYLMGGKGNETHKQPGRIAEYAAEMGYLPDDPRLDLSILDLSLLDFATQYEGQNINFVYAESPSNNAIKGIWAKMAPGAALICGLLNDPIRTEEINDMLGVKGVPAPPQDGAITVDYVKTWTKPVPAIVTPPAPSVEPENKEDAPSKRGRPKKDAEPGVDIEYPAIDSE